MDKFREAFEKLPEINAILHGSEFGFNESINQYYHPYHTEHRLNYAFLMGAWSVWQSRQAELDQAYEDIETFVQAHQRECDIKVQIANELKEKDKRIKQATAKWISIVTILTTTDTGVPDVIFKQLDQLHDALCGMNEIGDNNANS